MLQPFRQGDVLLVPTSDVDDTKPMQGLGHLVLAEGEVTGHRHQISQGKAELFEHEGDLYLKVISPIAKLTHEEHGPLNLPQGIWKVLRQREYEPNGWRYVAD